MTLYLNKEQLNIYYYIEQQEMEILLIHFIENVIILVGL